MFFVQPEYNRRVQQQYYEQPVSELNEICLLNNLQRQYAYRQQQYEKKQIQKINQPIVEFQQDLKKYYIILTKNINKFNYQFINKFNGYSLKRVDQSLIIRSTRDNFFKNVYLPLNIENENKDFEYNVLDNGFKLVISIPKKISYQNQIKSSNFGLPDILNSLNLLQGATEICAPMKTNNSADNCHSEHYIRKVPIVDGDDDNFSSDQEEVEEEGEEEAKENKKVDDSVDLYLCQDSGERSETCEGQDRCERRGQTKGEDKGKREQIEEQNNESREGEGKGNDREEEFNTNESIRLSRQGVTSSNVSKFGDIIINDEYNNEFISDFKRGSKGDNKEVKSNSNLLKNYNTIKRNTIFMPNTVVETKNQMDIDIDNNKDKDNIPVKRVKSPIIEEVIDEEFLK